MSRRPVDVIARSRDPEGRQVIWDAIRKIGSPFTRDQLNRETMITPQTIGAYLECLVAGGYLERIEGGEVLEWRLLKDSPHAPRLRRDGTPAKSGGGTENMWRTMRMMREFTPRDIASHATTDTVAVSEGTAKQYCAKLLGAGYLRVVQKAVPNKRQASYRLIRNSGPKAPQIQRVRVVFDPNDNSVHRPEAKA